MNINPNSQQPNMSISTGAYGSPKVVDSEPTSPFHQKKAFNVFSIPDNYNFAKSFNSNIYNSQNSDNRSLQPMQNGKMSPVTSVYPASSFYKPMASLYQPQIQSQSPKQYENVLSPSYQPSNKLTVVEKKEEPVEVKKTRTSRGRPRKSKDPITFLSSSTSPLTSHLASLSPSLLSSTTTNNNNNNYRNNNSTNITKITTTTNSILLDTQSTTTTASATANNNNNNNNNVFEPVAKPTQKPKSNSKSSSKSKKKTTSNKVEDNERKQSRIVFPDLDISSIFNDNDYYDYSFMTFSLKDKMLKSARNIKFLKENDSNNYYNEIFENGELISLNDDRFLLPSEVIKDIKFPKRKLEFVLISDNESDDEEKSNYKHVEKKIKIEENIKVKVEKEVVENNRRNEVVDNDNNNNNSIGNYNGNIPEIKSDINNFVQKAPVTPFYTHYEKFLEDCKTGKLKSV